MSYFSRFGFVILAGIVAFVTFEPALGQGPQATRPNILWLSAEDISPHLGCYGDSDAITPRLDRLASEGLRYTHAFTTAGVCAPCRSAIITGVYQTTLGTHHMRCNAKLPGEVRPFPALLREAGYYCTNNSKQDYQFKTPKDTWDESSRKAHWRNRPDPQQPFFAVFNFGGCHESGIANESKYREVTQNLTADQRQDPEQLELPPYYPDTAKTREDWKRNYELITAMDQWAGGLLDQLEEDGLSDNTIVMFWSDHGVGLPRAKRWLYDSGTHIPLLVRIPEPYRSTEQTPGSVCNELVSSLDFAPTLLNLAGVSVPEVCQGRAFLGPDLAPPRTYVFGARDRMDERYDIIRSVRDQRFRYIRNYEPFKPYYPYMNTPEKGATMRELRRLRAAGTLQGPPAIWMANHKPVEELYDLLSDPHEIHNLAEDPQYASVLSRLRTAHLDWVVRTRDLGLVPESEIERREQTAGSRFDILNDLPDSTLERIRATAVAATGGSEQVPSLAAALDDESPVVRYWAAMGLGNLSASAQPHAEKLQAALDDSAPCVRIAAARALLKLQQNAAALKVLKSELESEWEWARLRAAIVLGEAGEAARPLVPEMQACLENQPNKYITRVANRTLNVLLGTNNTVK